jgi:hypothetical protein
MADRSLRGSMSDLIRRRILHQILIVMACAAIFGSLCVRELAVDHNAIRHALYVRDGYGHVDNSVECTPTIPENTDVAHQWDGEAGCYWELPRNPDGSWQELVGAGANP